MYQRERVSFFQPVFFLVAGEIPGKCIRLLRFLRQFGKRRPEGFVVLVVA